MMLNMILSLSVIGQTRVKRSRWFNPAYKDPIIHIVHVHGLHSIIINVYITTHTAEMHIYHTKQNMFQQIWSFITYTSSYTVHTKSSQCSCTIREVVHLWWVVFPSTSDWLQCSAPSDTHSSTRRNATKPPRMPSKPQQNLHIHTNIYPKRCKTHYIQLQQNSWRQLRRTQTLIL